MESDEFVFGEFSVVVRVGMTEETSIVALVEAVIVVVNSLQEFGLV